MASILGIALIIVGILLTVKKVNSASLFTKGTFLSFIFYLIIGFVFSVKQYDISFLEIIFDIYFFLPFIAIFLLIISINAKSSKGKTVSIILLAVFVIVWVAIGNRNVPQIGPNALFSIMLTFLFVAVSFFFGIINPLMTALLVCNLMNHFLYHNQLDQYKVLDILGLFGFDSIFHSGLLKIVFVLISSGFTTIDVIEFFNNNN